MEGETRRHLKSATGRGHTLERLLAVAMSCPGPFTRAELIEATGLSGPTVGFLTAQLTARGLTRDLGTGPSRGGRRPALMEFNARHGFVAGIDLGPTRTRVAIADLRGNSLAHRIIPTPNRLAPPAALGSIAKVVRELMCEAGAPPDRLLAVGAGAPGVVDVNRGVVVLAPNLAGWSNVPMRDCLEEALGAPTLIENDVNLALLGEHWKGAARGHRTCAFLFVGTGIGAAVLIDGKLHRGHHFMAGEIAMMCMAPEYVNVPYRRRAAAWRRWRACTRWRRDGPRRAGRPRVVAAQAVRGGQLRGRERRAGHRRDGDAARHRRSQHRQRRRSVDPAARRRAVCERGAAGRCR